MSIAFLSISSGRVDRGVEVWVHELAQRLQARHRTVVFQSGKNRQSDYLIRPISIPFVPHQSRRWNIAYHFCVFLFTLRCLPCLWRERYDWIIPVNGYTQALLCRIIRWLRGGKLMIAGHAGIGRDDRFNIMFGKPDVFVALTRRAHDWSKNIGANSVYIPNGVDTGLFRPEGARVAIPLKQPIVLCVAALVPYKRIELLIQAVAKTKASLLLIGDGSERGSVVSLGNALLGERFMHIPSIPHPDMPSYYRAADVFSLPSEESEAFGLVYLEAMACNVPVVAPDDENRRKVIGEGGIVCSVENADTYAAALEKAVTANWENKPRRQAEKYSWDRIVGCYEKIMV